MKKNLLILGLVVSLSAFSQTSKDLFNGFCKQHKINDNAKKTLTIVNLKDSSYYWAWDNANTMWSLPTRTVFGYNTVYKENSSIITAWDGFTWFNNNKNINYVFDGNSNLLSFETQVWSGVWINSSKTINTFDASNNQLTATNQTWDGGSLTWENSYKYVNTFDASKNLLTSTTQTWNVGMSVWVNAYKSTATYNANKEYTTYIDQIWNTSTTSWNNSGKMINIVYSAGDFTNAEYHIWNTSTLAYEPLAKIVWSYDGNHHLLNDLSHSWVSASNSWVNSYKTAYTYDSNGNQITLLSQTWDGQSGSWVNSYRQYDYYTSFVGLKDRAIQHSEINVYPNPTSKNIVISSGQFTINEISVIDVTGKIVFSEKLNPSAEIAIDISQLNCGVYFISVKNEKSVIYKKFIKE